MIRLIRRKCSPLERTIGYVFRNKDLLKLALVHPSFRFESGGEGDNQRLEFLGDAILGFVTAAYIYEKYEDREEGVLTSMRSRITSGKALARIGHEIGIGENIQLGKGEDNSGGRRRASNLADAVEALIAAAYLDGGSKAAEQIFHKLFVPELESMSHDFWEDNPKGCLQDVAQRRFRSVPKYKIMQEDGPSHRRVFTVSVSINGLTIGTGSGTNKQQAEAQAAARALERLSAEQNMVAAR